MGVLVGCSVAGCLRLECVTMHRPNVFEAMASQYYEYYAALYMWLH